MHLGEFDFFILTNLTLMSFKVTIKKTERTRKKVMYIYFGFCFSSWHGFYLSLIKSKIKPNCCLRFYFTSSFLLSLSLSLFIIIFDFFFTCKTIRFDFLCRFARLLFGALTRNRGLTRDTANEFILCNFFASRLIFGLFFLFHFHLLLLSVDF